MPRDHPRQSWYFSLCTFSRPIAFILATPHSSAFLSTGVPVTREPMSSLSSVRYWKACESIIPSPAILTSAGFVPSSSGPFGAGRLSARAVHAALKENPSATAATPVKTRRIRILLTPSRTQTLSPCQTCKAWNRFRGYGASAPLYAFLYRRRFAPGRIAALYPSPCRNPAPLSSLPYPTTHPTLPFVGTMKLSGRPLLFLRILSPLLLIAFAMRAALAQQPVQKPVEKTSEKKAEKVATPEKEANPAQIELLETRYRFEANGDSRKEVHTSVHINSELGRSEERRVGKE